MAPTDVVLDMPLPQTPPSSPELPAYKHTISLEHVQLFVDLLKAAQAIQGAPAAARDIQQASIGEKPGNRKASRARASKVEFKAVNEMYVHSQMQSYKAKITAL